MKKAIYIGAFIFVYFMVLQACSEAAQKEPTKEITKEKKEVKKSLNPNGDSELALLMREMFKDAKRIKKQIEKGEIVTAKFDHGKILSAHATEPEKAASKAYKTWGAAYLSGVKSLKESTPETVEVAYTSLIQSCMNCHTALCPGPVVKIKKLELSK